ncbi:MAG: beta-glucosidase [Christensenellales bacterium]|mgnify:CR=1 FL=1|jgi:beta-glucosidase|nr:glycosyl hydrolase [Clostridiales bacterium]
MDNKIKDIIAKLTLEEKAALCSGVSSWETTPIKRLGIPSINMADGPHGMRKEVYEASFTNLFDKSYPATCFPPAATVASTWNRDLVYKMGKALANEAKDQEVAVVLGPGINIKRSPLCGRNFEYLSEDPYLTAELGIAYVDGVQSENVGTSVKHYAVNSQEFRRLISSSEIDERALREIYLYAFEQIVKRSNPYTIMSAYNQVNGVYASENKLLLKDILKEEWGYKGVVVSDWGAVTDRVEGVKAGLHLEMPTSGGERDAEIVRAVKEGALSEDVLDDLLADLLSFIFKCDANLAKNKGFKADYASNHILAKEVANEGAVLLKNDGILPLKEGVDLAVVGKLAEHMRYQGGGSSNVVPKHEVSFLSYLDTLGVKYSYSPGYTIECDKISESMIKDAANSTIGKDVVLVYVGLTDDFESESFDREHLEIPKAHTKLIEEVYKVNKNIIIVLTGGSPSKVSYYDKARAILYIGLTGESGGESNYELLTGKVNPSGKLAETFAIDLDDELSNQYFGLPFAEYRESIFVGYRYFDKAKKDVMFPFGFGLSYTKFEYSNIEVSHKSLKYGEKLTVSFNVKNIGHYFGAEVAQLYISNKESKQIMPLKELKGFEKVFLSPGEEKTIKIELDDRSFSFYNVDEKEWQIEGGEFDVLVGSSSRHILLKETVFHKGNEKNVADYTLIAPSYFNLEKVESIPLADFEHLLGRNVNPYIRPTHKKYTMNTCIGELHPKGFARFFRWIAKIGGQRLGSAGKQTKAKKKMLYEGTLNIPMRNLYAQSMGRVSKRTVEGLLFMLNGRFFKGLAKTISGLMEKRADKKETYGDAPELVDND